jgi:superfamily II RNA helicase
LIFCSSRKGCESTAKHISKFLRRFSVNVHNDESEFVDITSAIDALRRCPAGLDPILEETVPSGVAYHHAGLTVFICFFVYLFCSGYLFHFSRYVIACFLCLLIDLEYFLLVETGIEKILE